MDNNGNEGVVEGQHDTSPNNKANNGRIDLNSFIATSLPLHAHSNMPSYATNDRSRTGGRTGNTGMPYLNHNVQAGAPASGSGSLPGPSGPPGSNSAYIGQDLPPGPLSDWTSRTNRVLDEPTNANGKRPYREDLAATSASQTHPIEYDPSLTGHPPASTNTPTSPSNPTQGQQHSRRAESSEEAKDGDDMKGGNGRFLKQTKRAAQNRAAQQAFRKRKEERIKELEDKEKLLDGFVAREAELVRREHEVAEREARLAIGHTSPITNFHEQTSLEENGQSDPGNPLSTVEQLVRQVLETEGLTEAAVDALKSKLEIVEKAIERSKSEINEHRKKSKESRALVDSLRRSLEDLGSENRSLRYIITKHGFNVESERAKLEGSA